MIFSSFIFLEKETGTKKKELILETTQNTTFMNKD